MILAEFAAFPLQEGRLFASKDRMSHDAV